MSDEQKKALEEHFRNYANAFEMAKVTKETDEEIEGWSDLIRKDTDLLAEVRRMVDPQKSSDERRRVAVLLCQHPKESVRYLADKIMKGEKFEIEDRSHITL
jgi:hypothetical protein